MNFANRSKSKQCLAVGINTRVCEAETHRRYTWFWIPKWNLQLPLSFSSMPVFPSPIRFFLLCRNSSDLKYGPTFAKIIIFFKCSKSKLKHVFLQDLWETWTKGLFFILYLFSILVNTLKHLACILFRHTKPQIWILNLPTHFGTQFIWLLLIPWNWNELE